MAKFIEVNEIGGGVVYLNADKIIKIEKEPEGKSGKGRIFYQSDKVYSIYVKETPAELLKMINSK